MIWHSLPAALVLASAFILGKDLPVRWRRAGISFAAGTSIAYVFVDLLPDLSVRQLAIASVYSLGAPLATALIYLIAMVGFIAFYVLDNMVVHRSPDHPSSSEQDDKRIYRVNILAFACYVAIISYSLLDFIATAKSLIAYTLAFFLHFLVIDYALRRTYGSRYDKLSRWLLGATVLAGWIIRILLPLSRTPISLLLGFISGAVVFNSIKDEMPRVGEGKVGWFMLGAVCFTILLFLR